MLATDTKLKFKRLHIPSGEITEDEKNYSMPRFLAMEKLYRDLNEWNASYSKDRTLWKYWTEET